ncbi:MAG: hypothetical protein J6T60_09830 [Bacteroidales bacterium]|nr:hypothetical protein [Bacteroidales bacterium]
MAQFVEISEKEKQRESVVECRTARLYREGTFLRAYEFSAWLFVKFVHDFKVSKRNVKGLEQPLVMIGFPIKSIDKYTPEGADVSPETDGCITVTISQMMLPDDADINALVSEYSEWKETIPLTESKKHDAAVETQHGSFSQSPTTITGVMRRILEYPIEQKSPIECMTFLSDVKRQLASLI